MGENLSSTAKETLLVVDDALDTREVIQRNLQGQGYRVLTASNVIEAEQLLETTAVDLVITDLKMPGASGLDLVRYVKEKLPDTTVMMISGYPLIADAIRAEEAGAEGYLAKPFTQNELFSFIRRGLDRLQTRRRAKEDQEYAALAGLVGESAPMRAVYESIRNVSQTSSPVLITGEHGTGKELAARAIHYGSPRSTLPFLSADTRSLPTIYADRELFGSLSPRTAGVKEGTALFRLANQGTIFITEVGVLPMAVQVKLLHLLRHGELIGGGSDERVPIDVRILAATDRPLFKMVEKESFHPELLNRLSAVTISMPPLRERGNDIGILVRHFIEKHAMDYGSRANRITDQALALLQSYSWPGNVIELENAVQRLVLSAAGEIIDVPDLTILSLSAMDASRLRRTLAEVEAEYVQAVLVSVSGNKSRAAEILGIDRKTLRKRLPIPGGSRE